MSTFIVFPFLVLENLRKFCGLKAKPIALIPRMKPIDRIIASCLSYHFGKWITEYTRIDADLDESHPKPNEFLEKKLLMLKFLLLSENDISLHETAYVSFAIKQDLPLNENLYVFGLENGLEEFLAVPIKCDRIGYARYYHLKLSDHAKRILRKHRDVDSVFLMGLERFCASQNQFPNIDQANQTINLAAAFECILDLPFNSSKREFKKAISHYYRDDIFAKWAEEFYDLRSSIHHGYRIKDSNIREKRGRLLTISDFRGSSLKGEHSPYDLLFTAKRVFSGIAYKRLIGKRVPYLPLKRKLTPNDQILKSIEDTLRVSGFYRSKFKELVEEIDRNDTSGSIRLVNSIISLCIVFLIEKDPSLSNVLNSVGSLKFAKGMDTRPLSLFRDLLMRTDILYQYISLPKLLDSSYEYDMIPIVEGICRLFSHFARIAMWGLK